MRWLPLYAVLMRGWDFYTARNMLEYLGLGWRETFFCCERRSRIHSVIVEIFDAASMAQNNIRAQVTWLNWNCCFGFVPAMLYLMLLLTIGESEQKATKSAGVVRDCDWVGWKQDFYQGHRDHVWNKLLNFWVIIFKLSSLMIFCCLLQCD